jgi:hypothetical protein
MSFTRAFTRKMVIGGAVAGGTGFALGSRDKCQFRSGILGNAEGIGNNLAGSKKNNQTNTGWGEPNDDSANFGVSGCCITPCRRWL